MEYMAQYPSGCRESGVKGRGFTRCSISKYHPFIEAILEKDSGCDSDLQDWIMEQNNARSHDRGQLNWGRLARNALRILYNSKCEENHKQIQLHAIYLT